MYGDYWYHLKVRYRSTLLKSPIMLFYFPLQTAQQMKDNPNFKIIWFEEMKKDLPKVIRDLCTFLGYELSPEKVFKAELLTIMIATLFLDSNVGSN